MIQGAQLPEVGYLFGVRPRPYPADLRAAWRISAILLAVDKSRGKRASVPQIHVLVWAMLNPEHGAELARAIRGEPGPVPPIRFDPAVARGVDRAIGFGLLRRDGKRLRVTESGQSWLDEVRGESELMEQEKSILAALGGPVSMASIDRIAGAAR